MTTLLVNWYKPSGKWYTNCRILVPANYATDFAEPKCSVQRLVEERQSVLQTTWVNGDWYVSVSAIEQPAEDTNFFERLFKYGSLK